MNTVYREQGNRAISEKMDTIGLNCVTWMKMDKSLYSWNEQWGGVNWIQICSPKSLWSRKLQVYWSVVIIDFANRLLGLLYQIYAANIDLNWPSLSRTLEGFPIFAIQFERRVLCKHTTRIPPMSNISITICCLRTKNATTSGQKNEIKIATTSNSE